VNENRPGRRWLIVSLLAAAALLCHSGCISAASVGHSGKVLVDLSHKADALHSAYVLPDGNIVVFVRGRLSGKEGAADFSLLVPQAALLKLKEEKQAAYASKSGDRTMFSYNASIGPSSELKSGPWNALKTDQARLRQTFTVSFSDSLPPQSAPVLYAMNRASGATNEQELKSLWGGVRLIYVDTYPDGTAFRCEIIPKAERIEKTRNGVAWLPVTIPLDVATLPAQALWGALFIAVSAAEAAGNR
jgi:hypothetical protein